VRVCVCLAAIKRAVEMIQAAKRPLLLVGAGANRKMTQKALREFVDKVRIPFFNTQMGKGVIDERHELFIGTAALSSKDLIHRAVDKGAPRRAAPHRSYMRAHADPAFLCLCAVGSRPDHQCGPRCN
jgi:hypothetical protein